MDHPDHCGRPHDGAHRGRCSDRRPAPAPAAGSAGPRAAHPAHGDVCPACRRLWNLPRPGRSHRTAGVDPDRPRRGRIGTGSRANHLGADPARSRWHQPCGSPRRHHRCHPATARASRLPPASRLRAARRRGAGRCPVVAAAPLRHRVAPVAGRGRARRRTQLGPPAPTSPSDLDRPTRPSAVRTTSGVIRCRGHPGDPGRLDCRTGVADGHPRAIRACLGQPQWESPRGQRWGRTGQR